MNVTLMSHSYRLSQFLFLLYLFELHCACGAVTLVPLLVPVLIMCLKSRLEVIQFSLVSSYVFFHLVSMSHGHTVSGFIMAIDYRR